MLHAVVIAFTMLRFYRRRRMAVELLLGSNDDGDDDYDDDDDGFERKQHEWFRTGTNMRMSNCGALGRLWVAKICDEKKNVEYDNR